MNRASNFLNPGWSVIFIFLVFIPTLYAQQPYVRGSMPRNGSENFIRNAFISARFELPEKGIGVDEETVDTSSVRLYPTQQPDQYVDAFIAINSFLRNITLEPKNLLESNTSYTFEITDRLKDQNGNAFKPYKASFTTNDLSLPKHMTTDKPDFLVIGPKVNKPVATRPLFVAEAETAPMGINNAAPIKTPLIPSRRVPDPEKNPTPKDTAVVSPELARTEASAPAPKTEVEAESEAKESEKIDVESLTPVISFRTETISLNGKVPVGFTFPQEEEVKYIVKDSTGKIVKRGSGKISAGIQTKLISMKDLEPGRYKMSVKVGKLLEDHIFTIQK